MLYICHCIITIIVSLATWYNHAAPGWFLDIRIYQLVIQLFVFTVPTSSFKPTPEIPAFQFVGSIDRNGSADKASLKQGDFLIEVSYVSYH